MEKDVIERMENMALDDRIEGKKIMRKKTEGKKSIKVEQKVPPKDEMEKDEDKENKRDSCIEEIKEEGEIGKRTENEDESVEDEEKAEENKEDSSKKREEGKKIATIKISEGEKEENEGSRKEKKKIR